MDFQEALEGLLFYVNFFSVLSDSAGLVVIHKHKGESEMPGNENNGGDPQNNTETFTKEQVQKMIDEAVTKAKADTTAEFKDHIKKLNEENAAKRIDLKDTKKLKEILAEALGFKPEEVKETDVLSAKITEVVNANKELAAKFEEAQKKAATYEKKAQVAELLKKSGLKDKAMNLVQLDAENLEEAVKKIAEDYPELKVNFNVGGNGSNPGIFNNSSMPNPYKKETLNLTKQFQLEQTDPNLAAKFKAEAGVK